MASKVSDCKSDHLTEDFFYVMSQFTLASFKNISLSLLFENLIVMCLSVLPFEFIFL